MRSVVQRVTRGKVSVDGKTVGEIGKGFVVLLGICRGDDEMAAKGLAGKILNLRIMADAQGKMNLSLADVGGGILVVPQFTLYADTSGRRPYFGQAAAPEAAKELFNLFVANLKKSYLKVETGKFGARMEVEILNDGPVTLILEV